MRVRLTPSAQDSNRISFQTSTQLLTWFLTRCYICIVSTPVKILSAVVCVILMFFVVWSTIRVQSVSATDYQESYPLSYPISSFDFDLDGNITVFDVRLLVERLTQPFHTFFDIDKNDKVNSLDFGIIGGYLHSVLPSPATSAWPSISPSVNPTFYPTPQPSPFGTPLPSPSPSPKETLLVSHVGQFTQTDDGFHTIIMEHPQSWTWGQIRDLTKPINYFNGTWHYRLMILNNPLNSTPRLRLCIWDMPEKTPLNCIKTFYPFGTTTEISSGMPTLHWTQIKGGALDVNDTRDLRMSLVLVDTMNVGGYPTECLVGKDNLMQYPGLYNCEYAFPEFKDIRFKLTVVMVSEGGTFSGWDKYY